MVYKVASPDLTGNETAYVQECVRSTWISSQGRFLDEFEERLAAYTETRHAIATCNGTVALHLLLVALDLKPGDEVIVPTLSFVATANAVRYCGASPVFADSDPVNGCIDPDSIARLITPRTVGVIPVHLWGHPCDMQAIQELADHHCLWVVEDAAEAIGSRYRDRAIGSLGHAAMFSFYGNKIVTTGEGGAITTNDTKLAERLRRLRGQGMDPSRRYWHDVLGFNYRMSNLVAAIGVAQMERVEHLVHRRRELAGWYQSDLAQSTSLTLPLEAAQTQHAWWMYSVLLPDWADRDRVVKDLATRDIETRPFFYPTHEMPMYVDDVTDAGCPTATDLSRRGICLPSSNYLMRDDTALIARSLLEVVASQRSCVNSRAARKEVATMTSSSPKLTIRPLEPGDSKTLSDFFVALSCDAETTRYFHPFPLDDQTANALCAEREDSSLRDQYVIAHFAGRIAALAMLRGWDAGYTVPSLGVCVHPGIRQAGLGKALLLHAIEVARTSGASSIRLTVYRENRRAVGMYEKLGFQLTEKTPSELLGVLDLNASGISDPESAVKLEELRDWAHRAA